MVGEDYRRRLAGGTNERRLERSLGVPVEDNAQRRYPGTGRSARGQLRVIGQHRAESSGDRIHVCAEPVYFPAGELVADPAPVSGGIVHRVIARQRELERNPWSRGAGGRKKKWSVELQCGWLLDCELDLDSEIGEVPRATTGQGRRVSGGDHDPFDPGLENRLRARRRLPE